METCGRYVAHLIQWFATPAAFNIEWEVFQREFLGVSNQGFCEVLLSLAGKDLAPFFFSEVDTGQKADKDDIDGWVRAPMWDFPCFEYAAWLPPPHDSFNFYVLDLRRPTLS